jgi:chemotaxis protein methyltransferase CheR
MSSILRPGARPGVAAPRAAAAAPAQDDYEAFCVAVMRLAKVDLLQYKRGQMERRIRTFVQKKGVADLQSYVARLKASEDELNEFLDRITINVSQLWRNPEQWTVVQRALLPELAQAGRVRCWSAGSSYGAEAYTLAAIAQEAIPQARVSITGTDIDRRMIARARIGAFSSDDARSAPKAALAKWFDRDGDDWVAKRALKALVSFEQGDLLRMRLPRAGYDLVLCRNTVIYFNDEVRNALHERIAGALRPGGYFVIGSTERVANAREIGLNPVRPFTYQKI